LSSEALHVGPPAATPGEARWGLSALYALAITAALSWAAWPGMMSYDSLFAIGEARTGVTTMLWPPMHAYLFWLADRTGVGPGAVLVLQVFLLFFGAALSLNLLLKSRGWAIAALAAFTLSFVYVPESYATLIVQWRDVTTTSFAVAGVAAWLVAARYGSTLALVLAALSIGLSLSLRYNAAALFVLIVPMMLWSPFLGRMLNARARGALIITLALACGLAWASTHVRLPDLKTLPAAQNFAGTQEFDLIGISACADKTYLPPALTSGWPITPRQIRQVYDPRHLNLAFRENPGAPTIRAMDLEGDVPKAWAIAVRKEFGCYLAHRTAVMMEQLGMDREDVFMPGYFSIDENDFGLKVAHRELTQRAFEYNKIREKELWRRPFLVLFAAPIALLAVWRRTPSRWLLAALLAGAYAYVALLFVAGPAADFRYIFPSVVLCCFVLSAAGAAFMEARASKLTPQRQPQLPSLALEGLLGVEVARSEGETVVTLRIRWPKLRRRAPATPPPP
jgi:hypothetical protein